MSLPKTEVQVIGMNPGKEKVVYKADWDGDLSDWIDIGGEVGSVLDKYEEIRIAFRRKS